MSPKNADDFTVDTSGVTSMLSGLSDRFGQETPGQSAGDGTTAQQHDSKTASRKDGATAQRRPAAPPAPPAEPEHRSKYTLLLDADDALALDQLALNLRRRTGRRVEKSEILRALIQIAFINPTTGEALGDALDCRPRP
ncbi:hypothetical protein [Actinacidiphila epipremni]|uniref:hypothetical protein n=1 Tax=Actinacidiphila epipremni TaxID=2053013 RepID=UPI0019D2A4A8|nr:hypothetical protein [Actinacidiphila epipremni]